MPEHEQPRLDECYNEHILTPPSVPHDLPVLATPTAPEPSQGELRQAWRALQIAALTLLAALLVGATILLVSLLLQGR